MLNPFPDFLTYSFFAPFILRVVLGAIFLNLGYLKFKSERERWIASCSALGLRPAEYWVSLFGAIQIIGGAMLILGFYTQIAALVFVIITLSELWVEYKEERILIRDIVFYLLVLTISLSLLLSGAGAFAIDLPL